MAHGFSPPKGATVAFPMVQMPLGGTPPLTIGAVNRVALGLVIAATLIAAPIGAGLAHRMKATKHKWFYGIVLFLMALNMVHKVMFS